MVYNGNYWKFCFWIISCIFRALPCKNAARNMMTQYSQFASQERYTQASPGVCRLKIRSDCTKHPPHPLNIYHLPSKYNLCTRNHEQPFSTFESARIWLPKTRLIPLIATPSVCSPRRPPCLRRRVDPESNHLAELNGVLPGIRRLFFEINSPLLQPTPARVRVRRRGRNLRDLRHVAAPRGPRPNPRGLGVVVCCTNRRRGASAWGVLQCVG